MQSIEWARLTNPRNASVRTLTRCEFADFIRCNTSCHPSQIRSLRTNFFMAGFSMQSIFELIVDIIIKFIIFPSILNFYKTLAFLSSNMIYSFTRLIDIHKWPCWVLQTSSVKRSFNFQSVISTSSPNGQSFFLLKIFLNLILVTFRYFPTFAFFRKSTRFIFLNKDEHMQLSHSLGLDFCQV